MTLFNESFYTEDFDQEMLDFIKDNLNTTKNLENEWNTNNPYLKYGTSSDYFWTGCIKIGKYLTKQQFKEKIGMTKENTSPDKQFEKKIKHWLVETLPDNSYHPKSFIATELRNTYDCIEGRKETGELFHCVLERWKYTPVYEDVAEDNTAPSDGNTFTKEMLVSGESIVETREGLRYLVAGDYLMGVSGYQVLNSVTDDLQDIDGDQEYDIVKVYSGRLGSDSIVAGKGVSHYIQSNSLTLVWERVSNEKRLQQEKVDSLKEDMKRLQNELQEAESVLEKM